MKIPGLVFLLMVLPSLSPAQRPNFSPKELSILQTMQSTFNIQGDTLGGTCFLVNKNSKQYFVTAAHLFRAANKSGDVVPVTIVVQNKAQYLEPKVYFHDNRNIDVAVMVLPEKIEQGPGITLDTTLAMFGSEVLFYGFPLTNLGTEIPMFKIKLPLVKRATLSGSIKYHDNDVLLLDGNNNRGFSGGPVLIFDSTKRRMCIIGVVSGFLNESRNVQYKGDKISFDENSGIILCYGRNYIEDIINK